MKYLLDTDTLSHLMRREPPMTLIRRMAAVPAEEQCTTSINYGELLYGAERRPDLRAVLLQRIAQVILPNLTVLVFDKPAARAYGKLRADLEALGAPIGGADTQVAAVALAHGLTVVSHNVRHFSRVPGLTVEDWLVD